MPRELTRRLEALQREVERQDEQWSEVEGQLRALSRRGVVVAREVIDEIDEAFAAPSHSAVFFHHHTFC